MGWGRLSRIANSQSVEILSNPVVSYRLGNRTSSVIAPKMGHVVHRLKGLFHSLSPRLSGLFKDSTCIALEVCPTDTVVTIIGIITAQAVSHEAPMKRR